MSEESAADGFCEVVVTAADAEWLAGFVRRLVEDRLAAAGHLFPIRSIYSWRDVLHDTAETRAALHTRASLVPAIVARAGAEHPYEVPCVVSLPFTGSDPAYLSWIADSTDRPVR